MTPAGPMWVAVEGVSSVVGTCLRQAAGFCCSLWQKSGLDSTDRTARSTLHGMAMGKRPGALQASPMWVNTEDLPTSDGHPFLVFPVAVHWLFRGCVVGAGNCVAGGGFAESAVVSSKG